MRLSLHCLTGSPPSWSTPSRLPKVTSAVDSSGVTAARKPTPSSSGRMFSGKSVPIIMSPTAVTVRPGWVGAGNGAGAGAASAGAGRGGAAGWVAQPAKVNAPSDATSAAQASRSRAAGFLITDADHERVQIGGAQSRAQAIELGEVADRPDAHAMPDIVIHRDALHGGVDALQLELRAD